MSQRKSKHKNLLDTGKSVPRGKFTAINIYIKKEKSLINNPSFHLKKWEEKNEYNVNKCRKKKTAEINEVEKRKLENISKIKDGSLKRSSL